MSEEKIQLSLDSMPALVAHKISSFLPDLSDKIAYARTNKNTLNRFKDTVNKAYLREKQYKQEYLRLDRCLEYYFPNKNGYINNAFTQMLAAVFKVDKSAFESSELFEIAFVAHARTFAPESTFEFLPKDSDITGGCGLLRMSYAVTGKPN